MRTQHPLAGKTVRLKLATADQDNLDGSEYRLEDWWANVSGGSWMEANGNPAAIKYAFRIGFATNPPADDEVVYGKVGLYGHLIHVSEIGEELPAA